MSLVSNEASVARSGEYQQTFENIKRLSSQLPDEAVISLAREVILRLAGSLDDKPDTALAPDADSVAVLATALISADPDAAAALIDERAAEGATVRELYLNWLGPAALQLGDWWDADEVSFVRVTVGTGRIYAIMRALGRSIAPTGKAQRQALFALVPGENHSLGVRMASDLFRKEGWSVDLQVSLDHNALVDHISSNRQVLIGLSAAGEHALSNLAKLVLAIRVCAPQSMVMVSGNIVNEAADKIRLMEVDAICSTFEEAKEWSDNLWQDHHVN